MMRPLDTAQIAAIDATTSRAERFWKHIPFVGWILADQMWQRRTLPIVENIATELKQRPVTNPSGWGEGEEHQAFAQTVCEIVQKEMGWPNDHFIPEDSAGVVFWAHEDGLDNVTAIMEMEDTFGIVVTDRDLERYGTQTLGEVIEDLWSRKVAVSVSGFER